MKSLYKLWKTVENKMGLPTIAGWRRGLDGDSSTSGNVKVKGLFSTCVLLSYIFLVKQTQNVDVEKYTSSLVLRHLNINKEQKLNVKNKYFCL